MLCYSFLLRSSSNFPIFVSHLIKKIASFVRKHHLKEKNQLESSSTRVDISQHITRQRQKHLFIMHVLKFMTPKDKVISCRSDHSIRTALDLMVTRKVGSVIVLSEDKDDRPLGIITRGDMLESFHKGMNPDEHTVSEIMHTGLIAVLDTMNRDEAAKVFEKEKKHHAVVIDKGGTWQGLISSLDIAFECAKDARAWPWNRLDAGKLTKEDIPGSPKGPIEIDRIHHDTRSSFAQYLDNLQYLDI